MKKTMTVILAASMVIICTASCSKSCNCTAKANGEIVEEEIFELEEGEMCSDFNGKINVGGTSAERMCTYDVF